MYSKKLRSLVLPISLIGASTLGSCVSLPRTAPVPHPPNEQWIARAESRWSDTSETELLLGRRLFMEKCKDCHRHPDVTYLPENEWPTTMVQMGKYAKLVASERRAVLRFILTARAAVFGHSAAFAEPEISTSEDTPKSEEGAQPEAAPPQ